MKPQTTHKKPAITRLEDKTSTNWLKTRTKDFQGFVLKKYIEKFGMIDGLFKFHETFRLVYMLRSEQDVQREAGIKLPKLEVSRRTNPEELW